MVEKLYYVHAHLISAFGLYLMFKDVHVAVMFHCICSARLPEHFERVYCSVKYGFRIRLTEC